MKSHALPKVLHGFAGRSLLGHVLAATAELGAAETVVVVGHRRDEVADHLQEIAPHARTAVQAEQHGTGHAVRIALGEMDERLDADRTVVVLPGDTPLLRAETLGRLVDAHRRAGAAATLLTSVVDDPTGYGRVIRGDTGVARVVEQKDGTAEELAVNEVASGVYAFDQARLRAAVQKLSTDNAQGEQYLPDVISIFAADGLLIEAVSAPAAETAGVNDRVQLSAAHGAYNWRLLREHMLAGVTVTDPASTWLDAGVAIEADAVLLPAVDLHGTTTIAAGAVIGPQVSLTDTVVGPGSRVSRTVGLGAQIGADCDIGPFAYLRPGTELADRVKIGTYVEVKKSDIGAGAKVPHLTYVGDATIGEYTNIGASSVFVNYDGVDKHRTIVGSHARTGSDTMFVAPVRVGDGAYTAAGSVITDDVPPGAMAVARARQRNILGWVLRRRAGTDAARAAERAGATLPIPPSVANDRANDTGYTKNTGYTNDTGYTKNTGYTNDTEGSASGKTATTDTATDEGHS
jgi:bifunctional UDP-N-acetylglucosamine pyrophosphorylase/glucosamine-1-phosphate N-acetyltransferase